MTKLDAYEAEVLAAYESGKLKPVATEAELARMRAAARATAINDRRVNIRLEEGIPYQTLIASILLKFVSGRFTERQQGETAIATKGAARRTSRPGSRAKPDA